MKERPIIFSAPMVRAILDGRKTQTRRVVKPQPPHGCSYTINGAGNAALCLHGEGPIDNNTVWVPPTPRSVDHRLPCPYGVPGDRLWVREAWQAFFADEVPADRPRGPRHTMGIPAQPERESFVFYRADGVLSHPEDGSEALWRPSIHMPRWASRITLEIVSVRVERVQEISEKDALAEGVESDDYLDRQEHFDSVAPPGSSGRPHPVTEFARLWDSINAKRAPWSSNPWVWVIEFRRVGE